MDVEVKMNERESEMKRLRNELDGSLSRVIALERQVNSLEQYSRRSCIRIFGLKEQHGENTDTLVCEVAKQINVNVTGRPIGAHAVISDPAASGPPYKKILHRRLKTQFRLRCCIMGLFTKYQLKTEN